MFNLKVYKNPPVDICYIGWGDTERHVIADHDLGRGVFPKQQHGLRRAVWDTAFGYVNGFRKRDILYYVLTRSLSKRVWERVDARNAKKGTHREFTALGLGMKEYVLETGQHF